MGATLAGVANKPLLNSLFGLGACWLGAVFSRLAAAVGLKSINVGVVVEAPGARLVVG